MSRKYMPGIFLENIRQSRPIRALRHEGNISTWDDGHR